MRQALSALLALMLLASCAELPRIEQSASVPVAPAWTLNPPLAADAIYFVGLASRATSLEDGSEAARQNALAQIAKYLGCSIQTIFMETSTEASQQISQKIKTDSSARITGAQLIDTYYQKTVRREGDFSLERYTVYVLVRVARQHLEQEGQRQEQERVALLTNADKAYRQGLSKQARAEHLGALRDFKQALALLDQTNGSYGELNCAQLEFKVRNAYQASLARLKLYRLEITVAGHAELTERFQEALSAPLAAQGFQYDAAGELTLKGQVHLSASSYVLGNHCYYAEGTLTALSRNQALKVISFKAKGFHPTQELARVNALQEAGRQAGAQLAETLFKEL